MVTWRVMGVGVVLAGMTGCGGGGGSAPTTAVEFERTLLPYTEPAAGVAALEGGGVVALASGFGVVTSADGGLSWNALYPLAGKHLATIGRQAFVGSAQGFYVFDVDAGTNAPVPTPFDPRTMTGLRGGGGRLWMSNGPIWVGENKGTSWRQVAGYDTFNGVLPDGTALVSGQFSGQWGVTRDGGATFTAVTTPPAAAPAAVVGLVALPSGTWLAYGGGIAASSDQGVTWTTRAPIAAITLASVAVDAAGTLWGVTAAPSRLVTSRDGGTTWETASTLGGDTVALADGVLFIASGAPPSGLLCRDADSTGLRLCGPRGAGPTGRGGTGEYALDDADDLWTNIQGHLLKRTPDDAWRFVHTTEIVSAAVAHDRPITTRPGKIITLSQHTEDGGATWIDHDLRLFPRSDRPVWHLTGLEVLPRSGKLVASIEVRDVSDLSVERGAVLTSSDDGRTWSLTSEQFLTAIFDLVSDQKDILFATMIVRGGDRIHVRSEDAGVTWTPIPDAAKLPVAIDHKGHLLAFTQGRSGDTVLTYWRSEAEGWLERPILPAAGVLLPDRTPRFDRADRLWFIGGTQATQESYLYRSKRPVTHD